jgi:signal transduction histidine kinase
MQDQASFRKRALLSYLSIVVPFAAAMAASIWQLASSAADQTRQLRLEGDEISLVQRSRSDAEVLVSLGRAYLITGDATLLTTLRRHDREFDQSLVALRDGSLSASELALLDEVEWLSHRFRRARAEILSHRSGGDGDSNLSQRFETELMPSSNALGQSLDRLVAHKEEALDRAYVAAMRAGAALAGWMYAGLVAVTLVGAGLALHFARVLSLSYRKEREARAAAQQAIKAREGLMGIVAHDLRNPLNAIALKAALLSQHALPEAAHRHAESMQRTTRTMANLINRLLDVSTLEAGQFSVTPAACAVASVLGETMETFGELAASKQIQLEVSVDPSNIVISADRERILQVLSNLVGNGLKVTPAGGRIGIRVQQGARMAHFSVWDTGPGIPPDACEHIFSRCWTRAVSGAKGTGLGLFIAKGIVDAHGGSIWVESPPGEGAKFAFTVPLLEAVHRKPGAERAVYVHASADS